MCTGISFTDKQGNLFFGRNLDVAGDYGEKVIITPRNYKIPLKHEKDIVTSKALIGMGINAGGYPLYFDCINENGLAMAMLNFPGLAYYSPEPVTGKINLAQYEFFAWVLNNFDTVAQAREGIKKVNFVNTPFSPQMPTAPGHWIIADNKETIVVEPMRDGVKIFDDPIGVLTNDPTFDWQMTNLRNYIGLDPHDVGTKNWGKTELKQWGVGTGSLGLPGDSIPSSRFVKAAYLNGHYPVVETEKQNVAKLFNILKSVAMVEGSVINPNDKLEYTVYSSCYSTKTKTYYYNRYDDFELKHIALNDDLMTSDHLTIIDK